MFCAGDEVTQVDAGGVFYVFSNAQVSIVDPVTLVVVSNLTTDSNGQPLTDAGSVGATGAAIVQTTAWECTACRLKSVFIAYIMRHNSLPVQMCMALQYHAPYV